MTTKVTFRVVGIYCYLPYLDLPVEPTHTVKEVMDSIVQVQPVPPGSPSGAQPFSYTDAGGSVDTMSYNYSSISTRPFNTFAVPVGGSRHETESIGSSEASVWQYYRSISGTFPGSDTLYEVKIANATFSQPKYSATPLNSGIQIPPNFTIFNYNLTWRLLRLQLAPEAAVARAERLGKTVKATV
ncbi:MAG: hypothetical protein ACKO1J_08660 [Tagaea sp.]